MISVSLHDDSVQSALDALRRRTADLKPALSSIGSSMVDEIKLGFMDSRSPYGAVWRALKVRRGQPLLDTGKLRNSMTFAVRGSDAVQIGTADKQEKAATHQFGSNNAWGRKIKVPARPFLPIRGNRVDLPDAWREEVLDILTSHLTRR